MASTRYSKALRVTALLTALLGAHRCIAAVDRWSPIGPFGGPVNAVVAHPTQADIQYAATRFNGIFKTTDGGDTWLPASQGLPARQVFSLALDPSRPQILYAGTPDGLFRSTDGGGSWKPLGHALPARQIAVSPTHPQTLYTRSDSPSRIERSDDGGTVWRPIPLPVPTLLAQFLAVDPRTPDTLYVGMAGFTSTPSARGLYKTTDAGAGWTLLPTGLPETEHALQRYALAAAPDRPDTLYATVATDDVPAASTLARSFDGGATWILAGGPGGFPLLALAGGRVVTDRARSTDYGVTWNPSTPPTGGATGLAASPVRPERVLLSASPQGLFRSLDGGLSYSPASRGLAATDIWGLAIAPDSTLFASSPGLATGNAATSRWESLFLPGTFPGSDPPPSRTFAVHPRRSGLLYAVVTGAAGETLLRTDNGGVTWTDLGRPGDSPTFDDLAVDPADPNGIYASLDGLRPPRGCWSFKSTDRGATWSCLPLARTVDFAVDPIDPRNVYALDVRLSKSTDRGATWTANGYNRGLPASGLPAEIVHAPATSGHLYLALLDGRIFRTTDGGRNWTAAQGNLPRRLNPSLAVDPRNSAVVYAAFPGVGVYRSRDGGRRWRLLDRGLSGEWLEGSFGYPVPLGVDPRDPATVYVGTNNRGVLSITLTN